MLTVTTSPVITPSFTADGKPVLLHNPDWSLIEYWTPVAHQIVDGLDLTLTWCAPPDARAAFLRLTMTNRRQQAVEAKLGVQASWGSLSRVTYTPVPLKGNLTAGLAPWVAVLVIVVPLAIGILHVWDIYQAKVHPADYTGPGITPTVTVQVTSGESAEQLAPTMLKDGVVESTRAFVLAAENSAHPTGLEPGFFVLNSHMQATLAWAALLNPKNRDQAVVTIPEGKRASQVLAIVAKETKIPLKDFQTVLAHPSALGLPSSADGKAEGYLFPATYPIEPHETALQILQAMVSRFNQEATAIDLPAAASRLGLTENQVIIEASMAQAEGGSVSDYPKIAEVINNRLRIHMALQFDSVLLYGLNAYAINVTDKQIATPGPYNDFEHAGLPPGPISNPGDAAIQGILHPATGNWIYFLTETGGKSVFSATPLKGQ